MNEIGLEDSISELMASWLQPVAAALFPDAPGPLAPVSPYFRSQAARRRAESPGLTPLRLHMGRDMMTFLRARPESSGALVAISCAPGSPCLTSSTSGADERHN